MASQPGCPICFEPLLEGDTLELPCPDKHRFCRGCLRQHIDSVAFPCCPQVRCPYELTDADVHLACGEGPSLEAFREKLLRRALAQLHGRVACTSQACGNVFICDPEQRRTRVACSCGQPAFCSMCRQGFHYHVECEAIQPLRTQWLWWISTGRKDYHQKCEGYDEASALHQAAVRLAIARHRELEEDEEWKANHCRLCPKCFRAIEKTEGCNSMICGQNYHGGNQQPGCGHRFDWDHAPKYKPRVERNKKLPELDVAGSRLRGAGVRHFFSSCSLCKKGIRGPRFRCVHCEFFECCIHCEGQLGGAHPADHVFEIIFEPVEPINRDLPVGTEVEIFGMEGNTSALNGVVAKILRYLPQSKMYDLDLPFGGGQPHVPAANVQPSGAETGHAAQTVLEAALAQQEARQFYLGLAEGQRIQLGLLDSHPDLSYAIARVDKYSPNGIVDYAVELEKAPTWACRMCTLLNPAQVEHCEACNTPRRKDQGKVLWFAAKDVSPVIRRADEVKDLAQRHWAEQGRLTTVAFANASACLCNLGLLPEQLVFLTEHRPEGAAEAGCAARVRSFDPWDRTYAVTLLPPQQELNLPNVPAAALQPVFWEADAPLQAADACHTRHAEERSRLEAVEAVSGQVADVFLDLQPGQWVYEPGTAVAPPERASVPEPVREYTEEEARQFQREHGVPPPRVQIRHDGDKRGVIVEYFPVTGKYSVQSYPPQLGSSNKGTRSVPVESVRPVLWGCADPVTRAETLVERHEAELRRLEEAKAAQAISTDCTLDLAAGSWIEVEGTMYKITEFDVWAAAYTVEGTSKLIPAETVRPVFLDATCPSLAAAKARARHTAEEERRRLVQEANTIAAEASLDLPAGYTVEYTAQDTGKVQRVIVERYIRTLGKYAVRDIKSGTHPKVEASAIRAVFWRSKEPVDDAFKARKADQAERRRLALCEEAAAEAKTCVLGMKPKSLMWAPEGGKASGPLKLWCVGRYLPEASAYEATLVDGSGSRQMVPFDQVQPAFVDEDDPMQAAAKRTKEHEDEVVRLEAVRVANAAALEVVKTGGFLGLENPQVVELVGEGKWRRPNLEHSGRGTVARFNPSTRMYDVLLVTEDTRSISNANTVQDIGPRHIAPTFWHDENPAEALRKVQEKHVMEAERLKIVQSLLERVQTANLHLPPTTYITQAGCSAAQPDKVVSYCPLTQTYVVVPSLREQRSFSSSDAFAGRVPAANVTPYLWRSQDPESEVERIIQAHTKEKVRLAEVAACEAELPASGLLGLPVGLPVRLVQAVQPVQERRQTWREWLAKGLTAPFKAPPGCAAGDVAFIAAYHSDGTYTLAVQSDQQWNAVFPDDPTVVPGCIDYSLLGTTPSLRGRAPNVEARAIRPLLAGSRDPKATLEAIRQRDRAEQAKRATVKELLDLAPRGLLDIPAGTQVSIDGYGRGYVLAYNASAGSYSIRINAPKVGPRFRDGLPVGVLPITVEAVKLRPWLEDRATLQDLEVRHAMEQGRLGKVHEANQRAAGFPREALPRGTRVEVAAAMVPSGSRTRFGRIMAREEREGEVTYAVQLEAASISSDSSDSRVRVGVASLWPVFWASRHPLEDAQELAEALGLERQARVDTEAVGLMAAAGVTDAQLAAVEAEEVMALT